MQNIELVELLKSGAHFGHRASKWHPHMRSFIFGEKGGIHIIDLEKTREQMELAYKTVLDLTSQGKKVLFVGTKRQAQAVVKAAAEEAGMPYVTERWVGGLLTNYNVVSKMAKRLTKLKKQKEIGEWQKYTKKEALMLEREVEKLQRDLGGIEAMDRVPDIMFITDMKHDSTAVREAMRKGLTIIGICDTNVDPTKATIPIPANDDAVKAIELISQVIVQAVKEGSTEAAKRAVIAKAEADKKKSAEAAQRAKKAPLKKMGKKGKAPAKPKAGKKPEAKPAVKSPKKTSEAPQTADNK